MNSVCYPAIPTVPITVHVVIEMNGIQSKSTIILKNRQELEGFEIDILFRHALRQLHL